MIRIFDKWFEWKKWRKKIEIKSKPNEWKEEKKIQQNLLTLSIERME